MPRVVDCARHAGAHGAGEIHSDIQRGFIRAEVVAYDAFTKRGSMTACREHGESAWRARSTSYRTAISLTFDLPPNRTVQRIVVADPQVPFIEGDAELHVKSLITLRAVAPWREVRVIDVGRAMRLRKQCEPRAPASTATRTTGQGEPSR